MLRKGQRVGSSNVYVFSKYPFTSPLVTRFSDFSFRQSFSHLNDTRYIEEIFREYELFPL